MTTSNCHGCGAPIIWAIFDGKNIPLDSAESLDGPGRYIAEEFEGGAWHVVKLSPTAMIPGHRDHRRVCPVRR